jgi:uncharacterized repeat protein (TIGR01451 family)
MRSFSLIALLSLIGMLAGPAHAAAESKQNITLKNVAEIEVEVTAPNGKKEMKREPVVKAIPGTEVIFTTTFSNAGTRPAGNVVLTNPVPDNTAYVAGSAAGPNTEITYSVDGGKTFSTPEKLKIKEGKKERPALPSEYTHIRWTYKGELVPGKSGEVSFRVVIK